MGSKQNDSTSFPPSEPKLCANGCGFFGSPSNMNLCSKCYRDIRLKEDRAAAAISAVEKSFKPTNNKLEDPKILQESVPDESSKATTVAVSVPVSAESSEETGLAGAESGGSSSGDGDEAEPPRKKAAANRCLSCNKKVGLTGFKCRCGSTFCGIHRYPEKHECDFDFKEAGRDAIAKANLVVKADKVQKI